MDMDDKEAFQNARALVSQQFNRLQPPNFHKKIKILVDPALTATITQKTTHLNTTLATTFNHLDT